MAAAVIGLLNPPECPAPLIWRKGEGWSYERAGVTQANTPKEQLELARQFQANKDYGSALTAYRRLIRRWPTSYATADARMGLAECFNALGYRYRAFKEYQALLDKHPSTEHFETVLQRQFEIGNLFLAGERDKVFGVRMFPSVEKAAEIFGQIVKSAPYSKVAPEAQFRLGLVSEKRKEYVEAVRAYEKLVERYPQHPMAEVAQFQIGAAYQKEAARSEYDQNAANQAIAAYTEFLLRYPASDKVAEAEKRLAGLKLEQARGLFQIGQFYEKQRHYKAALVYYNDVIERSPECTWAVAARAKIEKLSPQVATP